MPPCFLENITISSGGGIFIVGWIDDSSSRLERVVVKFANAGSMAFEASNLARIRRQDVEAALSSGRHHPYGFWGFFSTDLMLNSQDCEITLHLANGASQAFALQARVIEDSEIRDVSLSYLAGAEYFGNRQIQAIISIERSVGREIINFNKKLSQSFCSNPYVERFSTSNRKLKGSIIVCLYGKAEFLFLQNSLFSGLPGIEDYEFIYVSNSPELSEQLLREATISKSVYGMDQTLVLLPGNAGFGAANNVAARYAHSNRLLIVNPDVFPRDRDWAKKHTDLVLSLPANQTALFGVPLYYDDGSLMHGGMYFESETMPSLDNKQLSRRTMLRVEHYGKGAPFDFVRFHTARPVPAVTGAFMSMNRHWYERLGGFTEDFVFGHYEDADLCLKSLALGVPAWMHDIKLWHLEGKGSTRMPVHEGGSLVNRWLFANNWEELIQAKLCGPNPQLAPLLPSEQPGNTNDAVPVADLNKLPAEKSRRKRTGSTSPNESAV